MRTIAVAAIVIALALVLLGIIVEAMGWLIVLGLVLLAVAAAAGWLGVRQASTIRRDGTP